MTRLRGRTSLMIIAMISFTLLVVIYHILGNEVDDVTSNRLNSRLRIDDASAGKNGPRFRFGDVYSLTDRTDLPWSINGKRQMEGQLAGNPRLTGKARMLNEQLYANSFTGTNALFKGHKIVHLDLKGAPPKVSYYKYLFGLLKKLGATGVLIEYEDMFPFEGAIKNISARNSYSVQDIAAIQEIADDNGLIVIPLVQTFGHMEFVLKLEEFKDYREVLRYPQVLCPTYNKTLSLIHAMIDQVVLSHPRGKHLHIGADEVYQIGECSRCLDVMVKKMWGKKQLFLDHVYQVAKYVKDKYPNLSVLMWDDEFREISPQEIMDKGLHSLVEPVVWKYTTDPGAMLTDQLWESYALVWKKVWIATAFKGATAPDRYYTDIAYHLENHQRWLEIIDRYSDQITFKGAILTGWQRYDHFSVLCELLPPALPSLAVCLTVLQASDLSGFPIEVPSRITEALQCDGSITLTIPEPQYGWTKCSFHGASIYSAIMRLYSLTQEINKMEQDNTFRGWLKPYNIKYSFSSPSHVEQAVVDLDRHKMEIMYIEKEIRTSMEDVYDSYTIQEWVETYIEPLNDKITQLWEAKEKILEKNSWPRRPLTKTEL